MTTITTAMNKAKTAMDSAKSNTVATKLNIRESARLNPATPRQIAWLKHAISDYGITLDLDTVISVSDASRHIGVIQVKINNGVFVKLAPVAKTWYALVVNESVSLKSFGGTFKEATAKANTLYPELVKLVTSNLKFAQTRASEAVLEFTVVPVEPILEEVVQTLDNDISSDLSKLELPALVELAKSLGIKLGNSKKASTIIARILAVA